MEVLVRNRILGLIVALTVFFPVVLSASPYQGRGRGGAIPIQTPVRIQTPVKMPVKIRDAKPVYPWVGIVNRLEGVVVLEITVDQTGRVTNATVLRGFGPAMPGRGGVALGRGLGRGRGSVAPPMGRGRVLEMPTMPPAGRGRGMGPRSTASFAFEMAALDAVKRWQYVPVRLNGTPVPVIITVAVPFKLGKEI